MDGDVRRRRGEDDLNAPSARDLQEEQRDAKLVAQVSQGWGVFFSSLAAAGVLLGVIMGLLPSRIDPVAFSLPPPPALTGPLAPNLALTQAQKVYHYELFGPESIVIDRDVIYTGVEEGRVVHVRDGRVRQLTTLGYDHNCSQVAGDGIKDPCSRPCGMRLDRLGNLLVADAYQGIFRINTETGTAHHLLETPLVVEGQDCKFFNDVEEGEEGWLYLTHSSSKWHRKYLRYMILEADSTGRLLAYHHPSDTVEVLMKGLAFANGLTLSNDGSSILVAETTKARIVRYYLKGPLKGQHDVFADNLPGWPDNIRRSGRGTYWVGLASIRHAGSFSLLDFAASRPWVRALIAKVVPLEAMGYLIPTHGLLVELDNKGHILRSLHDPQGHQVPSVSEAAEADGVLYLGSYYLPYLSRLHLPQEK